MGPLRISFLLLIAAALTQCRDIFSRGKDEESLPMVAFLCGKPAMHFTKGGWMKDEQTDCLTDPEQILTYCKKMYPKKDITNVVEARSKVTIKKWCSAGRSHCNHHGAHTVRPLKCLVGAFQSEALLVPDHCVFDHIHKTEECKSFQQWNETSLTSCTNRKMVQQSFAILLPCGVDVFGGVEFVCCPQEKTTKDKQKELFYPHSNAFENSKEDSLSFKRDDKTKDIFDDKMNDEDYEDEEDESDESDEESNEYDDYEYEDDGEDEYEDEEDEEDESDESMEQKPLPARMTPPSPPMGEKKKLMPEDPYMSYLHNPAPVAEEHTFFMKAKGELQKHHHEKVTKMMKEWAAARQRVQEMKTTDVKAAEKLNREITARFQKTYEALEQEGIAERKQLVALHQQRIQAELNDKKRHAMEHYMAALQKNKVDAGMILKSLKHYIKTEEKDRMHTVNHFKHLRDTDPAEAERIRQQTLDHLAIIDQRVKQSIEMLNRVPEYAKKIHAQIDEFMPTFHEIDNSISNLLVREPEKPTEQQKIVEKYQKAEQKLTDKKDLKETELPDPAKPTPDIIRVPLNNKPVLKPTKYDDEVMEDEHAYIDVKPHVAHQSENLLSAKESSYIHKEPMSDEVSVRTGSTLGIAVGCIAVFVIIVIGIVVLRKKARRVPVNHGFVEVDQAASPEERHVTNMQINGYENPTYKYFEMGTTNA